MLNELLSRSGYAHPAMNIGSPPPLKKALLEQNLLRPPGMPGQLSGHGLNHQLHSAAAHQKLLDSIHQRIRIEQGSDSMAHNTANAAMTLALNMQSPTINTSMRSY